MLRLPAGRVTAATPHRLAGAAVDPFRSALEASGLVFDRQQTAAIDALSAPPRHGFYIWGDVGRGKSLISEAYFAAIPTDRKRRFHFHDFFRALQEQIIRQREPLDRSLRGLIGNARAVFFDEFHVHDVADGVYLTATLKSLLDDGILLLATSNYEPSALMPNPLFHDRFLPAIDLIRAEFDVVHLGDGEDYRQARAHTSHGFGAGAWRLRPDAQTRAAPTLLNAAGHSIRAQRIDGNRAEFTFDDLCAQPLGVAQYLWLAERFRSIALTSVPDLASITRDPLARFANLIDVLYDRNIPLHVHAAGEPQRLLLAAEPPRDAHRTVSRLSTLTVS